TVCRARDLRFVEADWVERDAPTRPIFARVMPFASECVSNRSVRVERANAIVPEVRILPRVERDQVVSVRLSVFATTVNAACKREGNFFPRFSARRKIPAQARALKKYRCGT